MRSGFFWPKISELICQTHDLSYSRFGGRFWRKPEPLSSSRIYMRRINPVISPDRAAQTRRLIRLAYSLQVLPVVWLGA